MTRILFVYPDSRVGSEVCFIAEGFVIESPDDIVFHEDGRVVLQQEITRTVFPKNKLGKEDPTLPPVIEGTGRKKTITVLPHYLWYEIEEK